jgi:hypothetical protein
MCRVSVLQDQLDPPSYPFMLDANAVGGFRFALASRNPLHAVAAQRNFGMQEPAVVRWCVACSSGAGAFVYFAVACRCEVVGEEDVAG